MAILQRTEAQQRSQLIDVTAYDVELDLTQGDETFESVSTITFGCRRPGESTFVDLKADRVHAVTLNGAPVDVARVADGRLTLTGLDADNTLSVRSTMRYGHDGQGLHRAVDTADGNAYVYGMSFLDAGPQVFACFDQPDLKAPYDVRVTAPPDWIVAGNGAATRTAPGHWTLATTHPMSTYYVTVCAGPYATVIDEHDGIRLFLHARASLAQQLRAQSADLFEVTKQGFDYYHELFGIRYPWGDYHQFFVPEFNAGAMENPGCVTLRDQYVFRGTPSEQELLTRANTVVHEMAHMWFGDLVTMTWWDDLWLNESFAEYMAHRTCVEATRYTGAWVDMGIARKNWGYAADRAPSTHPVAGSPAPDADSALTNFDGISYAKGASALRQLSAYIGDDAFIAGVRDHLTSHAFGNATFAQFLGSMEKAGGRSLQEWAAAWLGSAGTDIIGLDVQRQDGRITAATLERGTPAEHPADRPHVLDVAGYRGGRRAWQQRVTLTGGRQRVPQLDGKPEAEVIVPNSTDLTWATARFDDRTLDALPTTLATIEDAGARGVIWTGLLSGMALGTVDPRVLLRTFVDAWPVETDQSLVGTVADLVRQSLPGIYLAREHTPQVMSRLTDSARRMLDRVDPATARAVPPARLQATSSTDEDLLRAWADGVDAPPVLNGDPDFAWLALRRLASLGLADDQRIAAQLEVDHTMSGALNALRATAARPDAASKEQVWHRLTTDESLTAYQALALAGPFFHCRDLELVRPYVERYFTQIPPLARRLGEFAVARVATAAFPLTFVEPQLADRALEAITHGDLSAGVRRSMVDALAMLDEALRSRATFGDGPL